MFKVNNRSTRARCSICSKLEIKTPEQRQWRRSGVFIVNFEHISHLSNVSIVDFEQVNAETSQNVNLHAALNKTSLENDSKIFLLTLAEIKWKKKKRKILFMVGRVDPLGRMSLKIYIS